MMTVASKVPFYQLCVLLDKISNKAGTDAKKELLGEFVEEWRIFHKKLHEDKTEPVTDSFYPAMRLLLPQLERERQAYGIKEHLLAKNYIDILALGKDSPAAQKLLNYRAPKTSKADAGDFASVCYWILKPRCPEKGTMTIEEVNKCLNEISIGHAAKEKAAVKRSLECMLRNMSAREQKWLIRMMMKEMKMGISQQSVFSVYHQDAEDLFNVKMSLEKVCTMLTDRSVRLHEVEISVFSPFRPMLGDRGSPNKVEKTMDNKSFFIETKFDGERMQLHRKDSEYKYFSRGGNDYTHTYGGNSFAGGNLTQFIDSCFKADVKECILDGEMCGFDPVTETIGSKGENFDIKHIDQKKYQPMLCVFDILLLNGKVLTNMPLRERKELMKTVLEPVPGRIIFSAYTEKRTNQDCVDALNEAIDDREEGIMVKDPQSTYRPNTRKGGWYKIKPEYIGGLMDELDLLVVGGYLGLGSRSSLMSHFLCAVAVPQETGDKPKLFHSFCRVGSGYSRKELYDFNDKLKDHWKPLSKKSNPPWLMLSSGMKRPDAYIEPDKSFILQIKAAEIIDSDQYKTNCTLRFPRVEKIRYDKPWYDCLTTTEVTELQQKSSGKLTGGYVEVNEDEEPTKKRRKIVSRHVKPTVMANFIGVDATNVKQVSELLDNKEICVINGPSSHSKAVLEKKIIEYGGSISQNPGQDTYCVLAEKVGLKVKNIIKNGVHDVVKAGWLLRCIEDGSFTDWRPSDMIHTSPSTAKKFALDYDRHGDSYFSGTTEEKLKLVFQKIEKESTAEKVSSEDIAQLEMKYFPHDSQLGLFRLARIYLDMYDVLGKKETHIKNSTLELQGLQLRYHGATICPDIDEDVSHVVIDQKDRNRVQSMRLMNRGRAKKFHIVESGWVDDCIEADKLVNEREYEPSS